MKHVFARLGIWLWYVGALLMVLLAIGVSLGQYYFPLLGDYREEWVRRANAELPFAVRIGGLRAEWTALSPTFYLSGLELRSRDDPGLTLVSARSAEISVDIFRSLFSLSPRLRRAVAEEVEFGFVETADGRWRLAGAGARGSRSDPQNILAFFLAIEEIDLRRAHLLVRLKDGSQVETHDAELLLENYRRFRRLHATLRQQADRGTLEMLVETRGDPRRRGQFEARSWARLDGVNLKGVRPLLPRELPVPDAALDAELWFNINRAGASSAQGSFSVARLPLDELVSSRSLEPLEDLHGRFVLDWRQGQGKLWLDGLGVDWYGQRFAFDRLRADLENRDGRRTARIAADYLDIGAIGRAINAAQVLDERWGGALADLDPYGGLANVRAEIPLVRGQGVNFRIAARMTDVSASPWRSAPGVRNAAGYVELGPGDGFAEIAGGAVSLEFPNIFTSDLDLDSLRGRIDWTRGAEGVRVWSELSHAQSGDSDFDLAFNLEFMRDEELDDQLSLSIGLRGGDAAALRRFVPYRADARLREWLDASILAAEIERASISYHSIFQRPQHPSSSLVQLALDVDGADIDYDPRWPGVRAARGHVLVNGSETRVWADYARVYDSELGPSRIELLPEGSSKRLYIQTQLRGNAGDGLRAINESPIAAMTAGALADWSAEGAMVADIRMDMPLGRELDASNGHVAVRANFNGVKLRLHDYDLVIDNFDGAILYDLASGVSGSELKGELWGRPLTARLGSDEATPPRLGIDVSGSASAADVANWLDFELAGYVQGESGFRLHMEQLAEGGFHSKLETDLVGVGSTLPAPLGKDAAASLALRLDWYPLGALTAVDMELQQLLRGAMLRLPTGSLAGEIALGVEPRRGGEGVRITGTLAETNAGDWIVATRALSEGNASRGGEHRSRLGLQGLRIDSARLLDATLSGLQLDSHWDDNDFLMSFEADLLAGKLRIPDAEQPFTIALQRLQLAPFVYDGAMEAATKPQPQQTEVPGPDQASGTDASSTDDPWLALRDTRIAPMLVDIEKLSLARKDFGHWSLQIEKPADVLELKDVSATMPGLRVGGMAEEGGALYRVSWRGQDVQSEVRARLEVEGAGELFESLGYGRIIDSRRGRVDVALSWPGKPMEFRMADVTGGLDFRLRDGNLTQEGSNNPLMRTLGMFSFDQVFRRLKLDFKDLFQTGLSFDTFKGAIDISEGRAQTREPIELKGPAARLRLSGRSDFRERTVDADLVMTLPIGSNLPWVAALAGGLPAAAGMFVASHLFEKEIGKFSSAVYKLSGSMDEPNLELVKVFDVASQAKKTPGGETEEPAVLNPAEQEPSSESGEQTPAHESQQPEAGESGNQRAGASAVGAAQSQPLVEEASGNSGDESVSESGDGNDDD